MGNAEQHGPGAEAEYTGPAAFRCTGGLGVVDVVLRSGFVCYRRNILLPLLLLLRLNICCCR